MTTERERRYKQVGLDRVIRRDWLERTASLQLAGNNDPAIKEMLQSDLQDSFRSQNTSVRGSIDKTITILMKVWVRTPEDLVSLRDAGLSLLTYLPKEQHTAVHWGMLGAAYPFWSRVATQVGRFLRLQGTATASHVQRRLREEYGERETVSRRVRYVLRSFVDWNMLSETSTNGVYSASPTILLDDPQLLVWLVEASLQAGEDGKAPLRALLDSPGLFPFQLPSSAREIPIEASDTLEVVRHGLDEDLIVLRS